MAQVPAPYCGFMGLFTATAVKLVTVQYGLLMCTFKKKRVQARLRPSDLISTSYTVPNCHTGCASFLTLQGRENSTVGLRGSR